MNDVVACIAIVFMAAMILAILGAGAWCLCQDLWCKHTSITRIDKGPWPDALGDFRCNKCGKNLFGQEL